MSEPQASDHLSDRQVTLALTWCEGCGRAATLADAGGFVWCDRCLPGSESDCLRLEDAWDGDDR